MLVIIGFIVVIGCVLGGYMAMGGKLGVLNQPFEFVIIGGAAFGAYITSNTKRVLGGTVGGLKRLLAGPKYKKKDYLEILGLLFVIFRFSKKKGMLALESHVESPKESSIFSQFPSFLNDHHALEFVCDYLRLLTMGSENPYHMDDLMVDEIETTHHEEMRISDALQTMADAAPALGIVAAVLGVIKTMGAITEPPEVLGKLIGGALVGTFLGVLLSYGIIGPMASGLKAIIEEDGNYFKSMKVGILAYMNGYAPSIAVEYARKGLPEQVRPTFLELETYINSLPDQS